MNTYLEHLFSLKGRVALVTGGSVGIGEMIAQAFLRAGATVYIASRKADVCNKTAERLSQYGICHAFAANVTSTDSIGELKDHIESREGGLDILVNNAGKSWREPFETYPEKAWDSDMRLNVKAPFLMVHAFLPLLESNASAEQPSQIINIGSVAGLRPSGYTGLYAYCSSKAAIHQLTKVLAGELVSRHVHVNAIAPGFFPSKLSINYSQSEDVKKTFDASIPVGCMGEPDDIGALAIAMASSKYLVGTVIPLEGGTLLH
jgi:NAD(P)-dependent dehydrogenase (short-subunit alcohol dehydrogenase family)